MRTRKFQVANIHEGLEQIRREVGEDAVILDTRKLATGGAAKYEISVGVVTEPKSQEAPRPVVSAPRAIKTPADRPSPQPRAGGSLGSLERMLRQMSHRMETIESEVRSLRRTQSKAMEQKAAMPQPRGLEIPQDVRQGLYRMMQSQSVDNFGATISSIYGELKSRGIMEQHVEELIALAMSEDSGWEDRPALLEDGICEQIARQVRTEAPIWANPRRFRERVHVLVGPTGVGKTTTIAKIAAHLQYKAHERVGVICTDTFRVGGVYQLRAYAELLEIDFAVAANAKELRDAQKALSDCDVILIDTVGHNPWDVSEKKGLTSREIRDVLAESNPKFHVCLSAVTDPRALSGIVETYMPLEPASLIFTKCDEAQGLGCLYSVASDSGLPISHICFGQRVPDTILGPTSEQITEWIVRGHGSLLRTMMAGTIDGKSRAQGRIQRG